jgi:hypothetical protein
VKIMSSHSRLAILPPGQDQAEITVPALRALVGEPVRSKARSLTALLAPGRERDVVEDLVVALERLELKCAAEVVLRLYGREPSEVTFHLGEPELGKRSQLVLDVLVDLRSI